MFHKALLLLLPTVAYAQIYMPNLNLIFISPAKDTDAPTLELAGATDTVITDTDRKIWNITDEQFKHMFESCYWVKERPRHVYLKSPRGKYKILNATVNNNNTTDDNYYYYQYDNNKTTNHDNNTIIYTIYNSTTIEEVHRHLRGKIRDYNISYETVVVTRESIKNDQDYTFNYTKNVGDMFKIRQNTATATWHTGGDMKRNIKISLRGWKGLDFGFSGEAPWGRKLKKSIYCFLYVTQTSVTTVKPGEKGEVQLVATKGTLEFHVDITASLTGGMVLHYAKEVDGFEDYYPDINDFLTECNRSRTVLSEVWIKIVFYADPHVVFKRG